jgi:hypothetical protein
MSQNTMKPCPICGIECQQLGARGNWVVCPNCEARAVDSTGRPITFGEQISKQGDVYIMGGPAAYFKEPDPEAGKICPEVSSTFTCWVDGTEVRLYEGVAGWLGLIVPRDSSL